ncbi:MAG: IPExxxVDY family protein [Aestuariibaculum sp.]
MAVHKLKLDDFMDESPYSLIAIYCAVEDYRLAYLLNKYLRIKLSRKITNSTLKDTDPLFSVFEWKDTKTLTTWNLVSNTCKTELLQENKDIQSLFSAQEKIITTHYLIPEYKKANYLLKINDDYSLEKEKNISKNIAKVPYVVTTFTIDTAQLKSKDNLIFI